MEPFVDLAPGADASPLAQHFAGIIREGLDDPSRRRTFSALKATVFLVDFDSGECVSFRFDHGRLTVHEGPIGVPSVTFGGPGKALYSLDRARLRDFGRLVWRRPRPLALDAESGATLPPPSAPAAGPRERLDALDLAGLLARGGLKVYGAVSHPRTVYRFMKLVSTGR